MHQLLKHQHLRHGLWLLPAAGFFVCTDPHRLPPILLIVAFGLLYAVCLSLTRWLITGLGTLGIWPVKPSTSRLVAYLVAGLPTLLLILQSIGQLSLHDVVTLVSFFVVAYFYIVRSRRSTA